MDWTEALVAIVAGAGLVLGIANAWISHLNKKKEFLGFLSHFNLWNWYPDDVGPGGHPDYDRWLQQIDRLYEYQGFVPRDMKDDYREMARLYSKGKLNDEERRSICRLTLEMREKANRKLE